MSTQALYRKWRSKNFDELVGQDHVVRTLRNAVLRERVGHAYLFCGPRGTGKTSMARILAKAMNCLADVTERPCGQCSMCQAIDEGRALDLIEIDAASNRGIDEIRKLREQVSFVPTEGRYKVYVVDEVHMLTPPAFNALLKTLEEPPAHAIFILATTEPHKIPQTILSRCQRFDFRRIPLQEAISHLSSIASQESLKIEPAVLEFIARTSTGSLRDAISLLDQLTAYGDEEITMAQTRVILGTASTGAVANLVKFLTAGQLGEGLRVIRDALDEGTDVHQLASQVVEYLRRVMLVQVSPKDGPLDVTTEELDDMREIAQRAPKPWLLQALRRFNDLESELRTSLEPQLSLELAFLESALSAGEQGDLPSSQVDAPARRESRTPRPKPRKPAPTKVASSGESEVEPAAATSDVDSHSHQVGKREDTDPQPQVAASSSTKGEDDSGVSQAKAMWPLVLRAMRPLSRSVEAILRDCEPVKAEGKVIVLGFSYDFHKKRMENSEHKSFVEETLGKLLGRPCVVRCELVSKEPDSQPTGNLEPQILEDPLVQEAVDHLGAQVVGMKSNKTRSPAQAEPSDSDSRTDGSTSDPDDSGTSEQEEGEL